MLSFLRFNFLVDQDGFDEVPPAGKDPTVSQEELFMREGGVW